MTLNEHPSNEEAVLQCDLSMARSVIRLNAVGYNHMCKPNPVKKLFALPISIIY
jgi:hypothetical protein